MSKEKALSLFRIEDIARVCHEVNKVYCESIGDYSQKFWDHCAPWQKESAVKGVQFMLDNPDCTPEDLHNGWLKEKTEQGWVYGDCKDEKKKTHPCCIPYSELPKEQQKKDDLFGGVVKSFKCIEESIINLAETKTNEQ